jgi:hypothetical protein
VAALNAGQLTWVPPPRDSSTEEQTSNGTAEKAGGAAGGSGSIMSLDLYYDTLLGAFERLIAGSKGDSQSGGLIAGAPRHEATDSVRDDNFALSQPHWDAG